MQSPLWWLRAVRILLALLGFKDAAAPTGTPPPTRCWRPRRPRAGHAGSKSTPPPSQITHFTLPIPLTLSHPPPPTTTRAPAAHDRKSGYVRLFWSRCVCACGFLSFINMYCVIFSQFVGSRARARKKRLGHWGAGVLLCVRRTNAASNGMSPSRQFLTNPAVTDIYVAHSLRTKQQVLY